MNELNDILQRKYGFSKDTIDLVNEAESEVGDILEERKKILEFNQYKVLSAFREENLQDRHFAWNTGYGYDDAGRTKAEEIYARVFGAEKALVRPTIASGTNAIAIALLGLLRPGDKLIYATGDPYDTLMNIIRTPKDQGSLRDFGVSYEGIPLKDNKIDLPALGEAIDANTKVVAIQRSVGYALRRAISIDEIREVCDFVHGINKDIFVFVDNCYGEFTETLEPTEVGADIMAASLIKNCGAGIALSGGYIIGREEPVELASYRMTNPATGDELGLMYGQTRNFMQGLFLAPSVVNNAIATSILLAKVFEKLGYEVLPKAEESRSDIVQTIVLGDKEKVKKFCEAIQNISPVDSGATPMEENMPGYEDKVIMAAGTFVQGSSIELTSDGPMREPYAVYFQGGLTYEHGKIAVMNVVEALK